VAGAAGFVADLLSRPVLVGYLAGLALIMFAGAAAMGSDSAAQAGWQRLTGRADEGSEVPGMGDAGPLTGCDRAP
jgi:MFS superfamily sulfate permease-like transporter